VQIETVQQFEMAIADVTPFQRRGNTGPENPKRETRTCNDNIVPHPAEKSVVATRYLQISRTNCAGSAQAESLTTI
jgi:hypothetical protein